MSPFIKPICSQLNRADYLLLHLVNLLQSIKQVKLETLATALPLPITFNSRKKVQRFLSLLQLTLAIWFPILQSWLKNEFEPQQVSMLPLTALNGDVLIY